MTELPEISQVFVSATAQDCKEYREAVRDYLHDDLERIKIFLQENWAEGGNFVVDVCQKKIKESDAYLGLFGYRYGWIPPDHTKSITELEFDWAVAHWSKGVSPIFILLPEKNSEADQQLKAWAQLFNEKDFSDEIARNAANARQQSFLSKVNQWVAAEGRILLFYKNKLELQRKSSHSISHWNMDLLRKALQDRRTPPGEIPSAELGHIGREDQLQMLRKALEAFHELDCERTISFLVHGPENFGQHEFAQFLCKWEEWENPKVCIGQASELDNIDALICWACGQLGEPITTGKASIETLASSLIARLTRSPVVFVIKTLGKNPDRLISFCDRFWKPLVDAIAGKSTNDRCKRLYCFVIEHWQLSDEGVIQTCTDKIDTENVDYHRLLLLPPLGEIKKTQIVKWLKDLKKNVGITIDEDQRIEIAQRVTQPDGKPPYVYNRLKLENFWQQ